MTLFPYTTLFRSNLVGLSLASVQYWQRSATFPAAAGLGRAGERVRGVVRVKWSRKGEEGGPGMVEIDERGRVLWAQGGVQLVVAMPLVACPGGKGASWSGSGAAPPLRGLAPLRPVGLGTAIGHG